MSVDCLCAGILVADHLCTPIDHLPRAGELVLAERLELNIGGCAANAAIDLARVGVNVAIVGCVGDDAFGRFIADTLRSAEVDTSLLQSLAGVDTSGTLIVNVAGEDRRFIHCVGANSQFTAQHIPWSSVEQCRVLYVGGYLLMEGLDPHALADLFCRARQRGVKTVLDVVHPGHGDAWPRLAPLLPHTDVFLPNIDEARLITGLDAARDQALRLHEAGAATVVITCGEQGNVLVADHLRLESSGYSMPFVGGTGAGDAFDAGYIAGMLANLEPAGCLTWGSALGASCVRAISATASVFSRDEAQAYIDAHPLEIRAW